MRLNSICTILVFTSCLILPTNGILQVLLHALSHSIPNIDPNHLMNQMMQSPDIQKYGTSLQNQIKTNLNPNNLQQIFQQNSQNWGISEQAPQNMEKTFTDINQLGFLLKQYLPPNFDFTSMMSQATNTNTPEVPKVEFNLHIPIERWTKKDVAEWWKERCPLGENNIYLEKVKNENLNGSDLLKFDEIYIVKMFGIPEEDELRQNKILDEIEILKKDIHDTCLRINNKNNDDFDEDKLDTLSKSFDNLANRAQPIISQILYVHGDNYITSKHNRNAYFKTIDELNTIALATSNQINTLEEALRKLLKEKSAKDEKIKVLQKENKENWKYKRIFYQKDREFRKLEKKNQGCEEENFDLIKKINKANMYLKNIWIMKNPEDSSEPSTTEKKKKISTPYFGPSFYNSEQEGDNFIFKKK